MCKAEHEKEVKDKSWSNHKILLKDTHLRLLMEGKDRRLMSLVPYLTVTIKRHLILNPQESSSVLHFRIPRKRHIEVRLGVYVSRWSLAYGV